MDPQRELLWLRRLRDLTRAFARATEGARLVEEILDAALELTDAERHWVGEMLLAVDAYSDDPGS